MLWAGNDHVNVGCLSCYFLGPSFAHTPSSSPFCCLQTGYDDDCLRLIYSSTTPFHRLRNPTAPPILTQNPSVSPRWHSRPPLTVIIHILQIAHTCPRLLSPSRAYASPSTKALITAHHFLQISTINTRLSSPLQPPKTHHHASGLFRAGGVFPTVRFDFDARGRLVTFSRQGPNPMKRTRMSTRGVGSTHTSWVGSGLSSPWANAAVASTTLGQWQKRRCIVSECL